ncbi:hypothetical protein QKT26_gp68 [Carcinus maenas nudivirus]|uniref:Uncharacterized protein n=1 Tax=Carcinus maenas nudivirus TaxID=2880837 RepID=A0AAE8Y3H7_9VIRU|nr:hypothetical protein QKT26_gp68 [Carcinus maenas nudivirus]UBZ25658.1 hypothetical protein CmNV_067 [Carcinus maenas nudivirus]
MSAFSQFAPSFRLASYDNVNNIAKILLPTVNLDTKQLPNLTTFNFPYIYMLGGLWNKKNLFETVDFKTYSTRYIDCSATNYTNDVTADNIKAFNLEAQLAPTLIYGHNNTSLHFMKPCSSEEEGNHATREDIADENTADMVTENMARDADTFVSLKNIQYSADVVSETNVRNFTTKIDLLPYDSGWLNYMVNGWRIRSYLRTATELYNQTVPVKLVGYLTDILNNWKGRSVELSNDQQRQDVEMITSECSTYLDALQSRQKADVEPDNVIYDSDSEMQQDSSVNLDLGS